MSLLRAAGSISAWTLGSRVLGLLRDVQAGSICPYHNDFQNASWFTMNNAIPDLGFPEAGIVAPTLGPEVPVEPERQERRAPLVGDQDHRPAATAVSTVGSTGRVSIG